jgi:hypothetical protein
MSREILIKDNFLPKLFFSPLQKHLLSTEIEWRYSKSATNNTKNDMNLQDHYFSHTVYGKNIGEENPSLVSAHYNKLQPILYFIEDKFNFHIKNLLRMNLTFITQRNENRETNFHIDFDYPHYVGILYLNTCNGPTLIEDKQIDFIENRMVFFDGSMKHAAVTQTDSAHRMNIVINIEGNFF